jgi:aromatic-L-amino-acid/L-tryptophan decarboxylase
MSGLGDMDPEAFRREAHRIADWIADYFAAPERYPVLSRVQPGEIASALPPAAPETGEPFDAIFDDFERIVMPGITHWNHPGFFAYFAISGSAPGVLAEFLSAALNVQAMLWRTSPAATELEEVTLGWLRQLVGLPEGFEGVIYDTASITTLHALAAARERAVGDVRSRGLAGRLDLPPLRVYCSIRCAGSRRMATTACGRKRSRPRSTRTRARGASRWPWSPPSAPRRPPASIRLERSRRSAGATGSGSMSMRHTPAWRR